MAGPALPLTGPEELLVTGLQLRGLQTLPSGQGEAVLAGVTVVVTWAPTGATGAVTRLTVLALLVHEEAGPALVHTLSVAHVEAVLTPVALSVVTVLTVFVLTGDTAPALLHTVAPLRARPVAVRPKLIVVIFTCDTHCGLLCVSRVVFTLLTAFVTRNTGLPSSICYFTFRALEGYTLSHPQPVARPTVHTVEGGGAGEAVVRAGLTAAPCRVVMPFRTRLATLTVKQVPGHTVHIFITARAVIGAFVSALLAGVVTRVTLLIHGVAPSPAADVTAPVIKKPCWGTLGTLLPLRTRALQAGGITQVAHSP